MGAILQTLHSLLHERRHLRGEDLCVLAGWGGRRHLVVAAETPEQTPVRELGQVEIAPFLSGRKAVQEEARPRFAGSQGGTPRA